MQKYKKAFKSKKIYSLEEVSELTGVKLSSVQRDFKLLLHYSDDDLEILLDCYRYSIEPPKGTDPGDSYEFTFNRKAKDARREKAKLAFRQKVKKIEEQRLAKVTKARELKRTKLAENSNSQHESSKLEQTSPTKIANAQSEGLSTESASQHYNPDQ